MKAGPKTGAGFTGWKFYNRKKCAGNRPGAEGW
jgi:hypothetical protein